MHDHHSLFDILGENNNPDYLKPLYSLFVLLSRCNGKTREIDSEIIERHQEIIDKQGYIMTTDLRKLPTLKLTPLSMVKNFGGMPTLLNEFIHENFAEIHIRNRLDFPERFVLASRRIYYEYLETNNIDQRVANKLVARIQMPELKVEEDECEHITKLSDMQLPYQHLKNNSFECYSNAAFVILVAAAKSNIKSGSR